VGTRVSDPGGVAHNQVPLKLRHLVEGDGDVGEQAETGVHAVDRLGTGRLGGHQLAGSVEPCGQLQPDRRASAGDLHDSIYGEGFPIGYDLHGHLLSFPVHYCTGLCGIGIMAPENRPTGRFVLR